MKDTHPCGRRPDSKRADWQEVRGWQIALFFPLIDADVDDDINDRSADVSPSERPLVEDAAAL